MKRILSIILALALIVSLVPAVFAAGEEDYIRYLISANSLSTANFVGEHPIPMENGMLLNTSKAYDTATGTISLATAAPTVQNVIKFLQGSIKGGTSSGSWANSELSLISYRPLEYYNYRAKSPGTSSKAPTDDWTPIRKFSSSTTTLFDETANTSAGYEKDSTGTAAKVYTMPSVLNENTAPFEMFGKNNDGMSHSFLAENSYYATFNLGKSTGITFEKNRGTFKESFFAIRIKIPETAEAGTYKIRIGNEYPKTPAAGVYGDHNASECELYMMKIGTSGVEGNFYKTTGSLVSFVDASGNELAYNTIVNSGNKLSGTYTSTGMSSDTFEDVLTLRPSDEYLLYFRIADGVLSDATIATEAAATNGKVFNNSGTYYQNFKISYIDLIPYETNAPVVLESAEISYDKTANKLSLVSAVMSNGTDATGYTVTYGMTGATGASINATTGVITPGTEDETVSVYADVTLDGVTVRAKLEKVIVRGYLEGRLSYIISADSLNDAAKEQIIGIDGSNDDIRNNELYLISWKPISYTMSGANAIRVAPGTEGAKTISNILNTNVTEKFELPGRSVEDNAPRLLSSGFISQFVCRRWASDTEIKSESYSSNNLSGRPKYIIKLYIPQKGAYKLSLSNNFTLGEAYSLYGNNFFKKDAAGNITSLGREAFTEVYFSKAEFDLPYGNATANPTTPQLQQILTEENKIGWYDSGRYEEKTTYNDKVLVADEAGEYYLTLITSPESFTKNPNVWHRDTNVDYQLFALSEIRLDPLAEDEEYKATFDAEVEDYTTSGSATVNAYTWIDGKEEALSLGNTIALGNRFIVDAPKKDGYTFLYWAKGASNQKNIITFQNKMAYKPSEGANYVIAVYKKDGADEGTTRAEFYNANGQFIEVVGADGKAPKYPSMAGFGVAGGWQLYGTDEIYGYDEEIADMAGTANKILVAKYDEEPVKVIVNGEEYAYGELVRMPALDSSKIFKGWKKNGELVSADKDYTFKAWENATVEAVYAESPIAYSGKFMKIILDTFEAGNETAVMAEFFGFEDVLEKGIMVNGIKIPMRGDTTQFTILADVDGEYIGYAILRDGDGFIEVTDGSANIE